MSAFVVGAAGFLGRNTIPALLASKFRLIALEHEQPIEPRSGLEIVRGSIRDLHSESVEALRSCETLIHVAGSTTPLISAHAPEQEFTEGVVPTLRLLEAAKGGRLKRIIYASSGGTVYGLPQSTPIDENHPTIPTSHYGAGKLAAEHAVRVWAESNHVTYYILRISNPYGPHQKLRGGQGVIGAWIQNALSGDPLEIWGDGSAVRDYIFVQDVVRAICAVCSAAPTQTSGIYNIGSGRGTNLLVVAKSILRQMNSKSEIRFAPARPYDVPINVLDTRKFHFTFRWESQTTLEEGIRLTIEWVNRDRDAPHAG